MASLGPLQWFRRSLWGCVVWTAIPGLAASAGAVDVTACGQTVARGEVGVLLNDRDCSTPAPGPAAVTLQNRATLQMNGHRVTFTPPAPETYGFGIECSVEAMQRLMERPEDWKPASWAGGRVPPSPSDCAAVP